LLKEGRRTWHFRVVMETAENTMGQVQICPHRSRILQQGGSFLAATTSSIAVRPGVPLESVKLAGDDRVLDEKFEGDDFEGVLVGGFEDDGASCSGLLDLEPAGGTDAPAVAGFEAGKAKLRHGCAEIVAKRLGGLKEGSVDDAADGVDAEVFGAGLAAAGAVEAGHRLAATDIKRLTEDVLATVLDGFDVGHAFYSNPRRSTDRGLRG